MKTKYADPVASIMTRDVHTIDVSDTLQNAEHLIKKYHIRHLPVLDGKKLVGMLGRTDLLRMSFVDEFGAEEANADNAIYSMLALKDVMISNPITIDVDQTVRDAAEVLTKKSFHALPVVKNGELVGMLSTSDLIRYFLESD